MVYGRVSWQIRIDRILKLVLMPIELLIEANRVKMNVNEIRFTKFTKFTKEPSINNVCQVTRSRNWSQPFQVDEPMSNVFKYVYIAQALFVCR